MYVYSTGYTLETEHGIAASNDPLGGDKHEGPFHHLVSRCRNGRTRHRWRSGLLQLEDRWLPHGHNGAARGICPIPVNSPASGRDATHFAARSCAPSPKSNGGYGTCCAPTTAAEENEGGACSRINGSRPTTFAREPGPLRSHRANDIPTRRSCRYPTGTTGSATASATASTAAPPGHHSNGNSAAGSHE